MSKPLLFIILCVVVLFFSCIENENPHQQYNEKNTYFLLQKSECLVSVNTLENGQIQERFSLPIDSHSIYSTDYKSFVVIIDTSTLEMEIHKIQNRSVEKYKIPHKIRPLCLLIHQNQIIIGGKYDQEILVQFDISKRKWYNLDVPQNILQYKKAIDDLFMYDSLLVAVDNVVMPKYTLMYTFTEEGKMQLEDFKKPHHNSTYENFHKGKTDSTYIGLLSSSYHQYSGLGIHISLYKNLSFSDNFSISMYENDSIFYFIQDLAILDKTLYVLSEEKGIGKFNIKDWYFGKKYSNEFYHHSEATFDKIQYRSFGKNTPQKFTKIPNTNYLIVTLKDKSGIFYHEFVN